MTTNDRAEKLRDALLYLLGAYHSTHGTYDPSLTGEQRHAARVACTAEICVETRAALDADRPRTALCAVRTSPGYNCTLPLGHGGNHQAWARPEEGDRYLVSEWTTAS